MEHPFINSETLKSKTLEELQQELAGLTTKLSFAYRTGNQPLVHQLNMVMESYKSEYNKKMDDMIKKQNIQTTVKVQKEGEMDKK